MERKKILNSLILTALLGAPVMNGEMQANTLAVFAADDSAPGGTVLTEKTQISIKSSADFSIEKRTFAFYQLLQADGYDNQSGFSYVVNPDYKEEIIGALNAYNSNTNGWVSLNTDSKNSSIVKALLDIKGSANINKFLNLLYHGQTTAPAFKGLTGTEATRIAKIGESNVNYNADTNTMTVEDLGYGYYLIMDITDKDSLSNESLSAVMATNAPGETVTLKASGTPNLEKKVESSVGSQIFVEGADYNIGDNIKYKLYTKLPNISMFKTYKLVFNDYLSEGLTFNGNLKVSIYDQFEGNILETFDFNKVANSSNESGKTTQSITTPTSATLEVISGSQDAVTEKGQNENTPVASVGSTKLTLTLDDILPVLKAKLVSAPAVIQAGEEAAQKAEDKYLEENPGETEAAIKAGEEAKTVAMDEKVSELLNGIYIEVTYDSILNDRAKTVEGTIGVEDENPNVAWLDFTSNPNFDGSGSWADNHGSTPKDGAEIFDFELDFSKKDQSGNALAGAEFNVYASNSNSPLVFTKEESGAYKIVNSDGYAKEAIEKSDDFYLYKTNNEGNKVYLEDSNRKKLVCTNVVVSADQSGYFSVRGLDSGSYTLKEVGIKDSDKYSLISGDIKVEIVPAFANEHSDNVVAPSATEDDQKKANEAIDSISSTILTGYYVTINYTDANGVDHHLLSRQGNLDSLSEPETGDDHEYSDFANTSASGAPIYNWEYDELAGTGGNTMFFVGGAALVAFAGAAVLALSSKKKNKA